MNESVKKGNMRNVCASGGVCLNAKQAVIKARYSTFIKYDATNQCIASVWAFNAMPRRSRESPARYSLVPEQHTDMWKTQRQANSELAELLANRKEWVEQKIESNI